jgi:hypothetical protein
MNYSEKSYWLYRGGAFALLIVSLAGLILLRRHHYIDQTLYLCLCGAVALAACWPIMHAHRFRDEIQRRAAEKRTYWGYQLGLMASIPVLLVLMMPGTAWLDGLMQFVSRNHAMPRIYFWAGFMLPVIFQVLGVLALRLLTKLRSGEQA